MDKTNNNIPLIQTSNSTLWKKLKYDLCPKYLGITLNGLFKQHIENTAAKLKIRNNIIHKSTGSSWGANLAIYVLDVFLVYTGSRYCKAFIKIFNCPYFGGVIFLYRAQMLTYYGVTV